MQPLPHDLPRTGDPVARAQSDRPGSTRTKPRSTTARRFNETVSALEDTVLLNVSADLPFAASRFCASEGLDRVVALSTFRSPEFGVDWGVRIEDGPLAGLTARAVVVLDAADRVVHAQLVPEIGDEPAYEAALDAVRST